MADVVVGRAAAEDLADLMRTYSLPPDTPERVARVLARLASFPEMGQRLAGRWEGTRYLVGPWPWMLVVYEHDPELDRVDVLTYPGRTQLDGCHHRRPLTCLTERSRAASPRGLEDRATHPPTPWSSSE